MTKLVVSNHNLFVYRLCDEFATSLCIEEWEDELKQEVALYLEKVKADPDNATFLKKQSVPAAKYLEAGFPCILTTNTMQRCESIFYLSL